MPGGPRAGRREASRSAGTGVGVARRQLAARPAGGDLRARACGSLPSDGAGVGRGRSASCAFPAAVSAGPSRGRPSGKAEAARPAASGGSGLGSVRKAPSLERPGPPAWPSREVPGPCSPRPPACVPWSGPLHKDQLRGHQAPHSPLHRPLPGRPLHPVHCTASLVPRGPCSARSPRARTHKKEPLSKRVDGQEPGGQGRPGSV